MDSQYKWLVLAELIILAIILLIKLIYHIMDKNKINKILKFFKHYKTKESNDKFEECIEIIKQNQKESKLKITNESSIYTKERLPKYIIKEEENDKND